MRIQIATRHCEIPESVRRRAEDLIGSVSRFDARARGAEVVFHVEKRRCVVEVVVSRERAEPVVATGTADEFRAALDQVAERLARALKRSRSRAINRKRSASAEVPSDGAEDDLDEDLELLA